MKTAITMLNIDVRASVSIDIGINIAPNVVIVRVHMVMHLQYACSDPCSYSSMVLRNVMIINVLLC